MKINIIGQPFYNIGDYAACKNITDLLENSAYDFSVITEITNKKDPWFDKLLGGKLKYLLPSYGRRRYILFTLFCVIFPFFAKFVFKNKGLKEIINSDFILVAPGGLELGLYRNWRLLFYLSFAYANKIPYGLYSRSFGGFSTCTFLDRVFKLITIFICRKSCFNSLRDIISQREAKKYNVKYISSIDIVFLENKVVSEYAIPYPKDSYIIFVPTWITWHPFFKNISELSLDSFYLSIITELLAKTNKFILLIPHMYYNNQDVNNYKRLIQKLNSNRVIIVDNLQSSNDYQKLYLDASFAIVTRYHQTVFAIMNKTPFISLTYESKMTGMLSFLGLEDYSFSIYDLIASNKASVIIDRYEDICLDLSRIRKQLSKSAMTANNIALDTYESFNLLFK
ncbi:polysaccharide pyruvyl transferase family protein [uncultured Bacteroides sp.]|uniref:polysaccharide pyruvyl transferase family protein n=1 Tax=uncultured Bacteroides sp. TaxID=162156 RepID=UPI002AA9118E|nr:polysaccharide pyruvyl transferase family protein [uncultured Bacteroides sp.]